MFANNVTYNGKCCIGVKLAHFAMGCMLKAEVGVQVSVNEEQTKVRLKRCALILRR